MPKAVLMEKGFEIDPPKKVVVLECTDDLFYVVLPAVEKQVLSPKVITVDFDIIGIASGDFFLESCKNIIF